MGCQSSSDHSHPMVSVMSLLLNLLFLFCMHLFRLRYLTVCLIYMLFGIVALNMIWLYNYWHIYIRLPTYENSQDGKSTDPFCHVSLTLASSPSLLFPFFFSLSLSPLLFLYFISLPQLSLASFDDCDPGVIGLSVPDRNLSYSVAPLSLSLSQLSLASFEESDPGVVGLSVPDRNLSYSVTLLSLSLPRLSLVSFEDSDPGVGGLSVPDRNLSYSVAPLSLSLSQLSLASFEDSDPGVVGLSVPDRNLSYSVTLLPLSLPQLSLASFEDSDPGVVGLSVPDRNLSYSVTLLSLSLPRSGKGPCIMHISKKMQWKVGSRYITPIQPYRFCRRLYPCYQKRLCSIVQLNYEDVLVVIWFPCWGPVWSMGWDANATLLFFYSTAPRTSCLGSPVARYHRPFGSRPVNSTKRETYQQLAVCSSPPYSGWFAPLSIPPRSLQLSDL